MNKFNYGRFTAWLLAIWFGIALTAAALGWIQQAPNQPPLPLLVAVLIPFGIFGLWVAVSKPFREFVLSLDPRALTLVHAWRLGGFAFIALARYHLLPAGFAFPAGYGDIFIGATAAFAASRLATPAHRRLFILWQILGMIDLVTAVTLGATAFLWNPGGITTAPMTVLPMSLIPTFAVPLYLLLHIICIAQARRWTKDHAANIDAHLKPFAV
jgi:hypothetical protein